MVEFNCPRCGYKTNKLSSMKDHLYNRKIICKPKLRNIDLEKFNIDILNGININEFEKKMSNYMNEQQQLTETPQSLDKISKIDDVFNYIYLLREREFIKTKENIFKIGFTTKDILIRTNGYPKHSKLYINLPVIGNPELKLIHIFKAKFIHRTDIGNEYFEGNVNDMLTIIKTL